MLEIYLYTYKYSSTNIIRAEIAKMAIEARIAMLSEVARRFGRSDAVICRSIRRYFAAEINKHQ
jgi:hypothetical protein